jgi:hypothetical protein
MSQTGPSGAETRDDGLSSPQKELENAGFIELDGATQSSRIR